MSSLFWPILWIAGMLIAVVAFAVTALRENSRQRAAALAMQPKAAPATDMEGSPNESMQNAESFPSENFEFDDGSLK